MTTHTTATVKGTLAHKSCYACEEGQMHCTDSRPSPAPGMWRRRRYTCNNCGHKMITHEVIIGDPHAEAAGMGDVRVVALRLRKKLNAVLAEEIGSLIGTPKQ